MTRKCKIIIVIVNYAPTSHPHITHPVFIRRKISLFSGYLSFKRKLGRKIKKMGADGSRQFNHFCNKIDIKRFTIKNSLYLIMIFAIISLLEKF